MPTVCAGHFGFVFSFQKNFSFIVCVYVMVCTGSHISTFFSPLRATMVYASAQTNVSASIALVGRMSSKYQCEQKKGRDTIEFIKIRDL